MNNVIDVKPNNQLVMDFKPNMQAVQGPTQAYTETRVIPVGMPIFFGGAFHLTYPTTGTFIGVRI